MYNYINNARDSVLVQFVKRENQIPRILNDILGIKVPLDHKPEYYDATAFEKDDIVYGLTCGVGSDMLVVVIENQYDRFSDLFPVMMIAAGRALASHGSYLKPVFIVLDNGEYTYDKGVRTVAPYNGGPDDFTMNVHCIAMRSYPDPDCNSPLWYYSDFISLVHKTMNTSPCPKAEQAIREAIDFDKSMAWFFEQKPERITQLAKEMRDPCDPDDEPDLAWAGSTI